MENCLVFKLLPGVRKGPAQIFSTRITNTSQESRLMYSVAVEPLKFYPIFVNYGCDFAISLFSQRQIRSYR